MSFYGPNSVDLIKRVYETIEITENRVNQHLFEIPYYFKLEKSQLVIQVMQRIIERNVRNQGDAMLDMLKTIVLVLGEILCLPKLLQYHHVLGLCTSKSNRLFLSELGKNPLLVKCKQCNHSYCAMCTANDHISHDIQYVLYQNPLFRCYSQSPVDPETDLSIFHLPRYPVRITFVDSNGDTYKQSQSRFIGYSQLSVTTLESLNTATTEQKATLLYFEIKVNQAGIQENITIGIDGIGITYQSTDGGIYNKNVLIGKGPRFGSYDTVGIGVTNTSKIYVTYNGLLNWPMLDCELSETMKPLVVLNSEKCDVEIKLRTWLFQPTSDQSANQDFVNRDVLNISEKLLRLLCKYIKKIFRKNPRDGKAQDLMEKYIEILGEVKRNDLIEETRVARLRFWPR